MVDSKGNLLALDLPKNTIYVLSANGNLSREVKLLERFRTNFIKSMKISADDEQERFVMFSCRTRGFCPSCHSKRLEEWGEWMREELLLDVPHRQVVFTIPKMLRIFFKYKRRLLGELSRAAVQALLKYLEAATGAELRPGVVAVIQSFGQKINFHPLCGAPHNE